MAQNILDEALNSEESLDRAAKEFYDFYVDHTKNDDDMNQNMISDEEFAEMFKHCGEETDPEYYRNFLKICDHD